MKLTLIAALAAALTLTACKTATPITGAAVQIIACELAKAKPEAKVPLHAAALVFKTYGGQVPPTQAELEAALDAIPKLGNMAQVEVSACWAIVCATYGAVYNSVSTPEQKVQLQLWLNTFGNALDNGSTCGGANVPAGVASQMLVNTSPTWNELALAASKELKRIQR